MASNLKYNIKATLHFNDFDLEALDETALVYNRAEYGPVNIGYFGQSKTFFESKEPLAQLRLNQIPENLIGKLNQNAYYIQISIYQLGIELYRNYYNVIDVITNTENNPRMGADLVDADIFLRSIIITRLNIDNTFSSLKVGFTNEAGYVKSKDLFYEKVPAALIDQYGDSIAVMNYINKNINHTGYKNLSFTSALSNKDNIDYMLSTYPLTLNPILYGFDEGFNASSTKNMTEFILVDLLDYESWQPISTEGSSFEKDPSTPVHSQPIISHIGPYFKSSFSDNMLTSKKRIKNILDNTLVDKEPLVKIRIPVFNKLNGKFSTISNAEKKNTSMIYIDTTLSEKDFDLKMLALLALYHKKPQIYVADFDKGAPYDYFRLGRRTNLFPCKYNLTIVSDISFLPIMDEADINDRKEVSDSTDPFICTGSVQSICYN